MTPLSMRATAIIVFIFVAMGCGGVSPAVSPDGLRDLGPADDAGSTEGSAAQPGDDAGVVSSSSDGTVCRPAAGEPKAVAGSCPLPAAGSVRMLHVTVELALGESRTVTLSDGKKATVQLLKLDPRLNAYSGYVETARAQVSVNGEEAWIDVGQYNLPAAVGGLQIDCDAVSSYLKDSPNRWGLGDGKDGRFRLWPGGSPLVQPGTFIYPVKMHRLFSDPTWFGNEVSADSLLPPGSTGVYYHTGLDIGGAEGQDEAVAAADGFINYAILDTVHITDGRGWDLRYFHLKSRDIPDCDGQSGPGCRMKVKMGQRIGIVGKEGGSGGWSHLHFDIEENHPGGYGKSVAYPFVWDAYVRQYAPAVIAVAGPIHNKPVRTGEVVTLEASRSRGFRGKTLSYEWTLTGRGTRTGVTVANAYPMPGSYSEVLKVTDEYCNTDWDFVEVYVGDPNKGIVAPAIVTSYYPTMNIQPGDPVSFKARTYHTNDGEETWDFGDGSTDTTKSKSVVEGTDANNLDPRGYAEIKHTYAAPGTYIVHVKRANRAGVTANKDLLVRVGEKVADSCASPPP